MKRRPARKLLRSIATLRSTLRRSRQRVCRLLAERPDAPPAQDCTYSPIFDHLDAELAAVERDLAGDLADELEDGQRALAASLRALADAEADVRYARFEADEAFARAGRVMSWVAWTLEGLCGLAGEEGLVGRIRASCG